MPGRRVDYWLWAYCGYQPRRYAALPAGGNGNLQKLVAGRDAATIAEKMLQYNKGGGKVLAGLVRRRQEEHDLFLS